MLILYVICPRFACWTLGNPKILFSLYRAMRTSRMTWHNQFGHWSTQSTFQLKWPKCPRSTLGLTKDQTRSKLPHNKIFHSFTSNPSFSEIFNNFDLKSIPGGPKNSNFDLTIQMGWNQCHCKDYQILIPTTIHGSKLKLEQLRYHKNRNDALIDAPQTSESHNFWFDHCIFEFHTFLET